MWIQVTKFQTKHQKKTPWIFFIKGRIQIRDPDTVPYLNDMDPKHRKKLT